MKAVTQPGPEALQTGEKVVPLWRELAADSLTPVSAYLRVVGDQEGFLLESAEGGERWGRFSFIGRRPAATVVARGSDVRIEGSIGADHPAPEGFLATLEGLLARYESAPQEHLPPLHGGLVGYIGYDVVREIEDLPSAPFDDRGLPDAMLWVIGQIVAFDHWRQRVVLVDNVFPEPGWGPTQAEEAWEAADRRLDELEDLLSRPVVGQEAPFVMETDDAQPEAKCNFAPREFSLAVQAAKEHIFAGDIFQLVLSQRFEFPLQADPFDVYRVLRQANPSPYMYFLRHPELSIVGSSPEPMVRCHAGKVISRPIAGTRRRGRTEAEDSLLEAELVEDPKERAEHVMLVDLARNDVGRVARYGSQRVDELMVVERYSHVMHITSQVSGELKEDLGPVDVLSATMPAGTVSGAPKVRAMSLIDELEPMRRGPYAGMVGYIDFSSNLDMAIAIRTMVVGADGTAWVQAGAGIVADSDPEAEDLECRNKAAGVLAAVGPARKLAANRAAGKERL